MIVSRLFVVLENALMPVFPAAMFEPPAKISFHLVSEIFF